MGKGETTHHAILETATALASRLGLEGLTIGGLAEELDLSKSGLFAHFRSKTALQVQVLDHAAQRFTAAVVRPALAQPRGEPRLRALFEGWLQWARARSGPGGCLFVAAATELDDRPGPARDRLVETQRAWLEVIARSVRSGMEDGVLRPDADPAQFAHDLYGVMLVWHHARRLMGDPNADRRARTAFEALMAGLRPVHKTAVSRRAASHRR